MLEIFDSWQFKFLIIFGYWFCTSPGPFLVAYYFNKMENQT